METEGTLSSAWDQHLASEVQFEGDKLAHEHLYWDQASVPSRSACSIERCQFAAARSRRKC
jgi:hypothetical protein